MEMAELESSDWGFGLAKLGSGKGTTRTSDLETIGAGWCGRINQIPDPSGSPEDLLMAREDAEDEDEEEPEITPAEFTAKLSPYISRLPDPERGAITLVMLQGRTQWDAATVLGVTQSTVVYRLRRGLERLRFWVKMPTWSEAELRGAIRMSLPALDCAVAVSFWRTTSCAETARELNISDFHAIRVLTRAIDKLQTVPGLACYGEALAKIREAGGMASSKRQMWEKK